MRGERRVIVGLEEEVLGVLAEGLVCWFSFWCIVGFVGLFL